jgi:tRNA (guanine10-N2)-dimethyltransferase
MIEFSGEHRTLPFEELKSVFESEDIDFSAELDSPAVGLVKAKDITGEFINRLALIRSFSKLHFICNEPEINDIVENAKKSLGNFKGTYSLESRRVLGYHRNLSLSELKKSIGAAIKTQSNGDAKVDMNSPETIFKLILSKKFYFGALMYQTDRKQFEVTHGRNRPFFSPVSLHPKYARVMVNLARVREGMDLLDPFCGTGGILIEGGAVGLNLYGSDISKKMIEGTKKNLERYGIAAESLTDCDIKECSIGLQKMDAVVTDPPYGRSASTSGEGIGALYERAFAAIKEILKPGRYLVIMLPDEEYISTGEDYFKLINQFAVYVHKSLTRHICVYQN